MNTERVGPLETNCEYPKYGHFSRFIPPHPFPQKSKKEEEVRKNAEENQMPHRVTHENYTFA